MKCVVCGTSLTGGLDTWGDIGEEMCLTCITDLERTNEPLSAEHCPRCDELMTELQESGLYHCGHCHRYFDFVRHMEISFEREVAANEEDNEED